MKEFSRLLSLLCILITSLLITCAANAGIPNNDDPTTFLGPTLRLGATNYVNDNMAYSVLGEAGLKNFRLNGTLGWRLEQNQRLKFSLDLLTQKITYPFFSGNTDEWVNQGALGGYYDYLFGGCYNPIVNLSAYISHANNKSLSDKQGTFVDSTGNTQTFLDQRRIAGSNAAGGALGFSVEPMMGTKAGLDLNYDSVRYDKNYSPGEDAIGFGGSARVRQMLADNVSLGLEAQVRQPFNYYNADVTWSNVPYFGMWDIGIEGGYVVGKNTLPNTYNAFLTFSYFFEQCVKQPVYKDQVARAVPDEFLHWTSDPAVYLPQVLAIPDEQVTIPNPLCTATPPTVIGRIPDTFVVTGGSATTDAAAAFSPATGLTYSMTTSAPIPPPATATINPSTGLITMTNPVGAGVVVIATVTATNACGQTATTTTQINYDEPPA